MMGGFVGGVIASLPVHAALGHDEPLGLLIAVLSFFVGPLSLLLPVLLVAGGVALGAALGLAGHRAWAGFARQQRGPGHDVESPQGHLPTGSQECGRDTAPLRIRPAAADDLHAAVRLLLSSRRTFIPYAPIAHGEEDVRAWMKALIATQGRVSVACLGGRVVGLLAVSSDEDANWIDQLYLAPGHTGQGIGHDLLAHALRALGRERPVRLYTFQANEGARRFYEREGFRTLALTDGAGNEERCPDVLYELPAIPRAPAA